MPYLADTKELGKLEIKTVYVYYDFPCLFSCVNEYGKIYIALFVGETEYEFKWYYVNVSLERLSIIESGEMDFRDAFKNTEDKMVWWVSIPKNEDKAVYIPSSDIPDEVLPKAGIKYQIK